MSDKALDQRVREYLDAQALPHTEAHIAEVQAYLLALERFEREKPTRWQDVAWESFPMRVTHDGREVTVGDMLEIERRVFDDEEVAEFDELVAAFNWDYLQHPDTYEGKVLSIGLYFGYPKCCVYSFGLLNRTWSAFSDEEKTLARPFLDTEPSWIPCADCLDYLREHGVDAYRAWSAQHPAHSPRHALDETDE